MPTYEYRCRNCLLRFERFLRVTDNPAILKCPECGGVGVRMISAGGGLLFKGSGFYATDYRKPARKPTKD